MRISSAEALAEAREARREELAGVLLVGFQRAGEQRRVERDEAGNRDIALGGTHHPADDLFLDARIVVPVRAVTPLPLAENLDEQLLARAEVVQQRGVRDADLLGDRPQRRALRALVGEDLDRTIQDLLASRDAFRVGPRPVRRGFVLGEVGRR